MGGVLFFLVLGASALVYANMRNAAMYCGALLQYRVYSEDELRARSRRQLMQSVMVGAGILLLVLGVLSPAQRALIPPPDRFFALVLIASLIFSQIHEQWALRECERLVPERVKERNRG